MTYAEFQSILKTASATAAQSRMVRAPYGATNEQMAAIQDIWAAADAKYEETVEAAKKELFSTPEDQRGPRIEE